MLRLGLLAAPELLTSRPCSPPWTFLILNSHSIHQDSVIKSEWVNGKISSLLDVTGHSAAWKSNVADVRHDQQKPCNITNSASVLPAYFADETQPSDSSKEIAKVALRLKYQIEQVIACEVEESLLTDPNSRIITRDVVDTAKRAGGEDYKACVVYCLLVCLRWFKIQANVELWDADLHQGRAVTCEVIAKRMYELLFLALLFR